MSGRTLAPCLPLSSDATMVFPNTKGPLWLLFRSQRRILSMNVTRWHCTMPSPCQPTYSHPSAHCPSDVAPIISRSVCHRNCTPGRLHRQTGSFHIHPSTLSVAVTISVMHVLFYKYKRGQLFWFGYILNSILLDNGHINNYPNTENCVKNRENGAWIEGQQDPQIYAS